jgi:hypothetical protein
MVDISYIREEDYATWQKQLVAVVLDDKIMTYINVFGTTMLVN